MTESALTWVIGRGGLLGRNVEAAFASVTRVWRAPESIDWSVPDGGATALQRQSQLFLEAVGQDPWSVAWCAGAGTVTASPDVLLKELSALRGMLDVLTDSPVAARGTIFFASSAGGVYAGVNRPPYDEFSEVQPLSRYGSAKLEAESLVAQWCEHTGSRALIGRIANIYGPGQNLSKPQGLISQICLSQLTRRPLAIYVPLDTLRDYLYAPDCAHMIVDSMMRLRREPSATDSDPVIKIFASQRAITVGAVLGEIRRIFKHPSHVVTALSSASSVQVRNLSLRSRVWTEVDHRGLSPLPVGVATTAADMGRQLRSGALSTL